jgi:hypothetical protein
LLVDEKVGVLVNVSPSLENWAEWKHETNGAVMVIGYLERRKYGCSRETRS